MPASNGTGHHQTSSIKHQVNADGRRSGNSNSSSQWALVAELVINDPGDKRQETTADRTTRSSLKGADGIVTVRSEREAWRSTAHSRFPLVGRCNWTLSAKSGKLEAEADCSPVERVPELTLMSLPVR